MPGATQTTVVEAVRALSPQVREIVLAPPPEPIPYRPGQWISLQLPVGEKPPLVRAYTLATPPSPTGHLVLALDRVPGGLGSGYLFAVEPGEEVTFGGPLGHFTLPDPLDRDLILVARYTGIVPFRSMLLALARQPLPVAVTLVYLAPAAEELVYQEEFLGYAAREPRFHYCPAVVAGEAAEVEQAIRLLEPRVGDRPPDYQPLVCGLKAFARPLRAWFQEHGFDRRQVKIETYD